MAKKYYKVVRSSGLDPNMFRSFMVNNRRLIAYYKIGEWTKKGIQRIHPFLIFDTFEGAHLFAHYNAAHETAYVFECEAKDVHAPKFKMHLMDFEGKLHFFERRWGWPTGTLSASAVKLTKRAERVE